MSVQTLRLSVPSQSNSGRLTRVAVGSVLLAFAALGPALADIKIGVTVSATGPAASLGIPYRNTLTMLPKEIAGEKVEVVILDDASDPTNAVKNARRLTTEDNVDILLGANTSPIALALVDVA